MEFAPAVALGDGVGRAEIDHVERAGGADEGNAAADDSAKAVSVAGNTPPIRRSQTSVVVRSITRCEHAGIDQLLHRAAADAGGVEDETFEIVAQLGRVFCTAGVVTPNMVMPIAGDRPARCVRAWPDCPDAPSPCRRWRWRHWQARTRDRVEALHVGDRIHHGDIGRSHVRADISRRDRRDDELRHADGKGATAGATSEAPPEPPAEMMPRLALAAQPVGEGVRHRRHRRAAVGPEHTRSAAPVVQRDFLGGDIAGGSLPLVETSTSRVASLVRRSRRE